MIFADEPQDRDQLLSRVSKLRGRRCGGCGGTLCNHELLFDVVTGFQNDPLCPACLATALGQAPDVVVAQARAYIDHRDCTRAAWARLSQDEPDCGLLRQPDAIRPASPEPVAHQAPLPASATSDDTMYDAGDLGCGDLMLEVRTRVRQLEPSAVLHLIARDPGAREDIPAWCSMTGHHLLSGQHPHYRIRRKDD